MLPKTLQASALVTSKLVQELYGSTLTWIVALCASNQLLGSIERSLVKWGMHFLTVIRLVACETSQTVLRQKDLALVNVSHVGLHDDPSGRKGTAKHQACRANSGMIRMYSCVSVW